MSQWWKLSQYPGYEISNDGQIRSYWVRSEGPRIDWDAEPRLLRPTPTTNGGLQIDLRHRDGVARTVTIAKLVLATFWRKPRPGEIVDYIDGNPANLSAANLRWSTRSSVAKAKILAGKWATAIGDLPARTKNEIRAAVSSGRMNKSDAARKYGLHRATIAKILKAKTDVAA